MARFAQYAMVSTDEALEDAGWKPSAFEQREATVCLELGLGLGACADCVPIGNLSGLGDWEFR